MLSSRGLRPAFAMRSNSARAFSSATRQFSGLRHCEPTWNVTPARSTPSFAAAATISRASDTPAPNLPESGQSLPMLGVAMRRYCLASGLISRTRRSSSRLSITYHSTPLDAGHGRAKAPDLAPHDGGVENQERAVVFLPCGLAHDLEVEADFGVSIENG